MGKKRIAVIDLSAEEKAQQAKAKPAIKPSKVADEVKPKIEKKEVKPSASKTKTVKAKKTPDTQKKAAKKPKSKISRQSPAHSQRHKKLRQQIDLNKNYSLPAALKLLMKMKPVGFDESVELHLNLKKGEVSGVVKFPHGTGKFQKIAIFNEQIEKKIKAGKLDFDLLVAKPSDMATIAKYAKILGPKGLMPNPKTGTISEKPATIIKKLTQETRFKTEKKAPLIHLVVGKISLGEKKLLANIEALFKVINIKQVTKAVLCSTMSPGIKISLE